MKTHVARTPYASQLERELEDGRRKAEKFFRRLLAEADKLPKAKLLTKAPAALAAAYALCSLMDGPCAQSPVALAAITDALKQLFEAEMEQRSMKG